MPDRDSGRFRRLFLAALAIGISLLFLQLIQSYLKALLLAGIFAALAQPLYRKMLGWVGGRQALASGLVLVAALVLIVGPLTAFMGVLARQAVDVSRSVTPWVQQQLENPSEIQAFLDKIPYLSEIAPSRDQMIAKGGEVAGKTATFVLNSVAEGTKGTARFLLHVFVMLYAMFFFLIDGRAILEKALSFLPLSRDDRESMLDRFTSVARATLKGTAVIGILQGGLAGLAFAVVGIGGSVFWGTLMVILSVIPAVGAALVWVPAAIYLAVIGRFGAAIGLTLWCALVVGTIDNLLRPKLVGQDTEMPDLLILISTLGGIAMFGAAGIIIGPIIAALFLTVWDLYGDAFSDVLPERAELIPETGSIPLSSLEETEPEASDDE